MEIRILTFGAAREITGNGVVTLLHVGGMTVADVIDELKSKFPGLNKLTSFAIAVNGAYTDKNTVIKQGDELAIIPPVSGG
jgi:MoaD family protein